MYKCLHETAPSYLADELEYTADFRTPMRLHFPFSLTLKFWMSVVHSCPSSVIGPSLLLLPVLGTVCPNMSRPHPLCLFSKVASRLFSSCAHSHDFYHNFYSACTVTVVIFGHFNRSFYLLTSDYSHAPSSCWSGL